MIWINGILLSIVIIFMFLSIMPYYHARKMRGRSAPNLKHFMNEKQKSAKRLLVYFWSPNCPVCRGMSKIVDELINSNMALLKINVQNDLDIAQSFKIMATPSLIVLEDGKIEQILIGVKSQREILALL